VRVIQIHLHSLHGRSRPFVPAGPYLTSDEVRKEISEQSE
jgi:hypothetical protein